MPLNKRHTFPVSQRKSSGAALVMVIAVVGGLAIGIMFFCLKYTGFIGSYHEQRSAIEAAALAAAKDVSAIVIDDPNFGLIGLSDSSPIGTNTSAGDNFYTPVTGINTLLGTIRLDMIAADYLQDPIMKTLVANDYQLALNAQQNLVAALKTAIDGGTGFDVNGKVLDPVKDATDIYNNHAVHLVAGQACSLVPGSLKLELGFVDGLATRTPTPRPDSVSNVSSSQQSQGFYLPNIDIPYQNSNFVFAAIGSDAKLVDFREFQATMPNLPFSTPTVVKIDADERYTESNLMSRTVHATAAALSGTIVDQRPNPGAFTITFMNGPVPEIVQPGDLINCVQIQADPTDLMQTPPDGDYPLSGMDEFALPMLPDTDPAHPRFENVLSVALYDWLKRGGTNVDIQSLVTMMKTPIDYGAGGAQMQRYHITSSGQITNDSVPWGQTNLTVSQKQFRAMSGLGIESSNGNSYDLQITDFVHQPGRTKGGLHAGEPLTWNGPTTNNAVAYAGPNLMENTTYPYQAFASGPGSGALRPTYMTDGIAVDFTVRKR